jgi:hypothetical protein
MDTSALQPSLSPPLRERRGCNPWDGAESPRLSRVSTKLGAVHKAAKREPGTSPALEGSKEAMIMYPILYIIGAIVVIIVLLKLVGLY